MEEETPQNDNSPPPPTPYTRTGPHAQPGGMRFQSGAYPTLLADSHLTRTQV